MKIKYTYSTEDVETLNCIAFVACIAALVAVTIAKIMGII